MNGAPRSQDDQTAVTGAVMALSPGTAWRAVPASAVESPHLLNGVAAAPSGDIWVVGNAGQQPLAAHWNGSEWTLPAAPPVNAALVGAGLQGIGLFPGSARPALAPMGRPRLSGATGMGPAGAAGPGVGVTPSDSSDADGAGSGDPSPAGAPPPLRALPSLTDERDERFIEDEVRRPALRVVPGTGLAPGPLAVAVGGGYDRLAGVEVPLLWHWDGRAWSEWTSWSDPGLESGYVLTDVAVVDANEAWAVGHGFPWGTVSGPVALRWADGGWRPVPLPQVARGKLLAVAGNAPGEVWAVGAAERSGLVLRHDGTGWRRASTPTTKSPLTDVAVCSSGEAWAVGRDHVLRWDGRKWRRVKAPVVAANTVVVPSPGNVWVAGGRGELAHFDGRNWEVVSAPQPFGSAAVWLASASAPGTDAWLAGTRQVVRRGSPDNAQTITARTSES